MHGDSVKRYSMASNCSLRCALSAGWMVVRSTQNDNLQAMALSQFMHQFFRKDPNGELSDVLIELPKSQVQVRDAKDIAGRYPFFTSGASVLRWDEPLAGGRNLLLNTGGNADVKFYVGDMAYSTDTWAVTARDGLADYAYLLLQAISPELDQKYFLGTGLRHLQKPLLKKRPIYIPSVSELRAFNAVVVPAMTMISENLRENRRLQELRDWLLPMLMNGQATVASSDKLSFAARCSHRRRGNPKREQPPTRVLPIGGGRHEATTHRGRSTGHAQRARQRPAQATRIHPASRV